MLTILVSCNYTSLCSANTESRVLLNNAVLEDGEWGTYTYSPITVGQPQVGQEPGNTGYFCEIASPGDLSSLTWTRKRFSSDAVRISFSALNFRDPMVATRRLNLSTLPYEGDTANLREL